MRLLSVWVEEMKRAIAHIHHFLSSLVLVGCLDILTGSEDEYFTRLCFLAVESFNKYTLLKVLLKDIQMLDEDAFIFLEEILVEVDGVCLTSCSCELQCEFTSIRSPIKHIQTLLC